MRNKAKLSLYLIWIIAISLLVGLCTIAMPTDFERDAKNAFMPDVNNHKKHASATIHLKETFDLTIISAIICDLKIKFSYQH